MSMILRARSPSQENWAADGPHISCGILTYPARRAGFPLPRKSGQRVDEAALTHQALSTWSPLSRSAGEGAEPSEAGEGDPALRQKEILTIASEGG